MTASLVYWVWLTMGLSPHNHRKWTVLRDMVFPEAIYDAVMQGEKLGFTDDEFFNLKYMSLSQAEFLIDSCIQRGINIYTPDEEGYPRKLLEIDDPPSVLFSYGKLEDVRFSPSVAVIGSRHSDDYALTCADRISYELAVRGVTIISGFARGVDTASHNAALRAGGQTIAVLGCGLGYDYPKGTRKFKERISENGAVISEYPPDSYPARVNFVVRNRIVSGLSDAVAVISAGRRSGTLNTSAHAAAQDKDLFVLPPHDILSGEYDGNIGLLRDGATPIYSYGDILNNLHSDLL